MAFDNKAYRKEYYQKNKEREKANSKLWKKNNPDKVKQNTKNTKIRQQTDGDAFLSDLFSKMKYSAKNRAKGRVIPVKVTKEDIKRLIINSNGRCALSGLKLTTVRNNPLKASLDRIDSSKGYINGNIQVVATCVNIAKSNLPQKDFIKMCKAIVDINS